MAQKFYGYIRSCVLIRKKFRRYGANRLDNLMKNRIRYSLTFFTLMARSVEPGHMTIAPKRALLSWADSAMWFIMDEVMREKTRWFNHLIYYMQRRMRQKCQTKDAKAEVIRY